MADDAYTAIERDGVWGVYAGWPAPAPPANARVDIWGQSNAIGRAARSDITASPLSSDAGLATFDAGTFARVFIWTGSAYAALTPASNNQANAGQFGPEFGLAVRWMRETTGGNLYLHKEGFSGVSIDFFVPTGSEYAQMRNRTNSATAWLASNSVTIGQRAWVWIQGESDSAMSQSDYQTKLAALRSARISDGIAAAGDLSVYAQMHPSTATYGAGPAAAKTALAAANPSVEKTLALPFYMQSDNIHLNGRGQVQSAYDAASIIFGFDSVTV
jgi:hypothetical protein